MCPVFTASALPYPLLQEMRESGELAEALQE